MYSPSHTVCFLKMVPSATFVLWSRKIVLIKRVNTEGTVFMKPSVVPKTHSLNRTLNNGRAL